MAQIHTLEPRTPAEQNHAESLLYETLAAHHDHYQLQNTLSPRGHIQFFLTQEDGWGCLITEDAPQKESEYAIKTPQRFIGANTTLPQQIMGALEKTLKRLATPQQPLVCDGLENLALYKKNKGLYVPEQLENARVFCEGGALMTPQEYLEHAEKNI